jgi:hypothetical protein
MAWYEREISYKDAYNMTLNSHGEISPFILDYYLQEKYKEYGSFGSYRGFGAFSLPEVLKNARKQHRREQIALKTLRGPLTFWMNHILYRPPHENIKTLRYQNIKCEFQQNLVNSKSTT